MDCLRIETNSPVLYLSTNAPLYTQATDSGAAGTAVLNARGELVQFVANHRAASCVHAVSGLAADGQVHEYQLVEATQQRPHDAGPRLGGGIEHVSVPPGYSIHIKPVPLVDTVAVLIVDSTGSGIGLAVPQCESWPALLRSRGKSVVVDGYGWRSVAHSLGTDAQVAAQVARVLKATKGAKQRIAYLQLGTNDRLWSGMDPAAVGAQQAKLVEGLHAADPLLQIKVASMFALASEGTAPAFRRAVQDMARAHPYVAYVDGLALAPAALLGPDGIHWSPAGQALQAKNLAHVLQ